ncbi:MAG: FIST C-terminal domain-containing protein [Planctomycetota bacterium]|jgi:hypothetical protein|nr:FIST C-terminal domain-containing protein [Planctomycetota bacterium]
MTFATALVQFNSPDRAENARAAAEAIRNKLTGIDPVQVCFFAGKNYEHTVLAAAVQDAFPGAVTFGCSSSGELEGVRMTRNSVSAMAFGKDVFGLFEPVLISRTGRDGGSLSVCESVGAAMGGIEKRLERKLDSLDHSKYVGMILADGIHYFVEPAVERIGDFTNIYCVGGIAGDDIQFRETPIYLNGRSYVDTLLFILAEPAGKFDFLKTQGLQVFPTTFTVTRADASARIVNELNGVPAVKAYCDAVGMAPEKLSLEDCQVWPLALMVGEEPFLRVVLGALPDGSLQLFHAVNEGMRMKLSHTENIVASTARALAAKKAEMGGNISAILHFNCAARQLALEKDGEAEQFSQLFNGCHHAGFSSHGEIYIAIANQTSTMLLFG